MILGASIDAALWWGRWVLVLAFFVALIIREWRGVNPLRLAREAAIAVGAYFAYFFVRGLTEGNEGRAIANAEDVIGFEQRLGFLWEPRWQAAIIDHQALVNIVNWLYIWGHWPFIALVAIWLYGERRPAFFLYRNAFMISGAIGLFVFALYPVAPPRFTDLAVVDTVTLYSESYRVLQPHALTNQFAAMPSLHFGWNLLIGIAIVSEARSLWARVLGGCVPMLMFFAVVLTANHFIIDAVAGGALALASLAVAARLTPPPAEWFSRSPEGVAVS